MKYEQEYLSWAIYKAEFMSMEEKEDVEKEVGHFIERWGGTDIQTLQRVLIQGGNKDRLIALLAIGYSEAPEALTILAPYFQTDNWAEHYASAYGLWFSHRELAYEELLRILFSEQTFSEDHDVFYFFWFYCELNQLVRDWEDDEHIRSDPRSVLALRQSHLLACQQVQRMIAKPQGKFGKSGDIEFLESYQDVIATTLGKWKCFDALENLPLSEPRLRVSRTFLCIGALGISNRNSNYFFLNAVSRFETAEKREVKKLLRDQYSMTIQEVEEFFYYMKKDYFMRFNEFH